MLNIESTVTRRRLLQWVGAAGTLAAGAGILGACAPGRSGARTGAVTSKPATPAPGNTGENEANAPVDLDIMLKAIPAEAQLLAGKLTGVWMYQAEVLKGDPASVQTLPNSYLGPVIRARKGQTVRVRFSNNLPDPAQESIIHWHGLRLPEDMDGHPRYSISPGQMYNYEFTVSDRAATYWFHPHPHERTAAQVYMGLAGLFIVSDEEEAAAGLPSGEYDVPLIIQDRTFDPNNQLVYLGGAVMAGGMGGMNGMGAMNHGSMMSGTQGMGNMPGTGDMQTMMDKVMGFLGDRILVNGAPDFVLPVATRPYRLRLLNGSNARIYKLGWSDGSPLTVIGTDNGLLEKPVQRPYVMLAPGERIEVWADFSGRKVGDEVMLNSLAFSGAESDDIPGMGGMSGMDHGAMGQDVMTNAQGMTDTQGMGGMMGMDRSQTLPLGAPFSILTVRVERQEQATLKLPDRLSTLERLRLEDAVNRNTPRSFGLTLQNMVWQINGRTFEMDAVADDEKVKSGDLEVWEFVNKTNPGEMMDPMGMAHPIHLHGAHFQIIDRQVLPELKAGWDTVREGYVDEGWKDTFLLMPGERVKLLLKFGDHMGKFVFHCHNLEHESQGMMRNYEVQA